MRGVMMNEYETIPVGNCCGLMESVQLNIEDGDIEEDKNSKKKLGLKKLIQDTLTRAEMCWSKAEKQAISQRRKYPGIENKSSICADRGETETASFSEKELEMAMERSIFNDEDNTLENKTSFTIVEKKIGNFDSLKNWREHGSLIEYGLGYATELTIESEDEYVVRVVPEDNTIPYILPENLMEKFLPFMPSTLVGRRWERLYSIVRDGDCFPTFLRKVENHQSTLMVIRTTTNEIIGGFADAPWNQTKHTFFGSGRSFLFRVFGDEDDGSVEIYEWMGEDRYIQLCCSTSGSLGMGGGSGNFGIFLEDNFTKGSSGPCSTFGNIRPLTKEQCFKIQDFEMYGFKNVW